MERKKPQNNEGFISSLMQAWQKAEETSYGVDPLLRSQSSSELCDLSRELWEHQRDWSVRNPEQSHLNPYTGLAVYISVRIEECTSS